MRAKILECSGASTPEPSPGLCPGRTGVLIAPPRPPAACVHTRSTHESRLSFTRLYKTQPSIENGHSSKCLAFFLARNAAMRDNDVGRWEEGGGGLSLMTFCNSEKLSNFKIHKLSWTVNELCTCLITDEKSSNIYKISKNLAKLNSY